MNVQWCIGFKYYGKNSTYQINRLCRVSHTYACDPQLQHRHTFAVYINVGMINI